MAKKSNNILWLGLAAVVALFAFKKPDNKPTDTGNDNGNNNAGSGNGGSEPTYKYPIFYNRYHPDVKLLQMQLGNVDVDGIIGPLTARALKAYGINFNSLSQIANRAALDVYINAIKAMQNNGTGFQYNFSQRNTIGCIC